MTTKKYESPQISPTKQKLLDVSTKLFSEKNFEDVSVDEICAAAGVTKGSFYHHFDSKYDIPIQQYRVIENYFFTDFNSTSTRDPEWRLRYTILWYASYCTPDKLNMFKNYYRVMLNSSKSRVMRKIAMEGMVFEEIIRVGQAKKFFRADISPESFSEIISRYIVSLLLDWVIFDGNVDLNRELSKLGEYVIKLISVRQNS